MLITIAGNNKYLARKQLSTIVDDFKKNHDELAIETIDAEEREVQDIIDAVQNLPFLSDKKLVISSNLASNKQATEKIEQIIDAANEAVDLVFYEPHLDRRSIYYKTLKSKTEFQDFTDLDASSLGRWLVEEAGRQGAKLDNEDATYLIDRVGANQALLANEVQKLALYSPQISRETIDLLTVKAPQSKIFDLLDAAFSSNKQKALDIYDEQRAQKIEPQEIIAMFAWQLRVFTAVKIADGKSLDSIAKDLGMSAYPVSKAAGLVRNINQAKLSEMVAELLAIDKHAKTKPIDLDQALKNYIVSI